MSLIKRSIGFFSEIRSEMKKVNWPTREKTIDYLVLVIIVVAVMTAILGSADFLFSYLIKAVISWL